MWRQGVAVVSACLVAACGPSIQATSYGAPGAQAYQGAVSVRATQPPPDAAQVGVVHVAGAAQLEDLVRAFAAETARVGGNQGIIDRAYGHFDLVSHPVTQTYRCGSSTCTSTSMQTSEVYTLTLLGRAYRLQGGTR